MKENNKTKNKKIFKFIIKVVNILVFIVLACFILVVCLQRFSGNKISFFNFRMFTVITGSMEPKYSVGDVLISKEVKPASIKVGDTISYLGEKRDFKDKVITHQVIGIEQEENGKYLFRARGLANATEDPIVSESQLYGVVMYKSLILSTIYRIVRTEIGFYIFIIVPIVFIIGSEIITTLLDKEEKRREKLKNNS